MATNKSKAPRKGASAGEPSNYSKLYKSSAAGAGVMPVAEKTPAKAEKRAATPVIAPTAGAETVDWKGEYGYVLKDLRRLGLVTLGLVVAIIVVGFFL